MAFCDRLNWGWVVTGATCVAFFFSYGFILAFSVLFVTFQSEFGSGTTAVAWVGSLPFGLAGMASPPVNLLIERIGYRAVTALGLALLVVSLLITSFMHSLTPIYFTYSALYALGTGCIMFGSFNLILEYFPVRHSTSGIVLPMAFSNLGMLSLGPLVYFLENRFGWRNTLRIVAGMIAGSAFPACVWAHRQPRHLHAPVVTKEGTIRDDDDDDVKTPLPPMRISRGEDTKCVSSEHLKEIPIAGEKRCPDHMKSTDKDSAISISTVGTHTMSLAKGITNDDNEHDKEEGTGLMKRTPDAVYDKLPSCDQHQKKEREKNEGLAMRILTAFTFPDLWCLAIAVFGYGLTNSFFIIQLVSYMMSMGFSEEVGTHTVVALGVSMMVGKVTLVVISDYLPFHQLLLSAFASLTGIAAMVCLLLARSLGVVMTMVVVLGSIVFSISDSLPFFSPNLVFGASRGRQTSTILAFVHGMGLISASLLGESLDKTGSYDIAIYLCICTYALCGVLCLIVPVYQKNFVRDRDVMILWKGFGIKQSGAKSSRV